jgi:hypothetical protein
MQLPGFAFGCKETGKLILLSTDARATSGAGSAGNAPFEAAGY